MALNVVSGRHGQEDASRRDLVLFLLDPWLT